VRQYVQSTYKGTGKAGGVAGVSAKDGKLLWYFPNPRYEIYAIIPTPIIRDNLVYVTAGYSAGCNLLKITQDAQGEFKAAEVYSDRSQKAMKNEHGGVVLVGNNLYGYSDGLGWICQEFKTGKVLWNEKNQLEGKGSLTCADDQLYLYSDEGTAALIKALPMGWEENGRFDLPEKSKVPEMRKTSQSALIWTHPVVANGRLYLRDQELLFCFDVREKK
jgi:outer membrane protein assembly factor BamB